MKDLWTVASFTMKDMIKRKSFIVSTLIFLVIIVVAFNIPRIMDSISGGDLNEKVLVIDEQSLFGDSIELLNQMDLGYTFEKSNGELEREQIKQSIENGDFDSIISFTKQDDAVKMEYIVESSAMYFGEVPQVLISVFTNLYSNIQISNLNLSQEELAAINPNFEIQLTETDENAAQGNVAIMMIISIVLFYAVFFCAGQVSSSITTEKTSKIMETLITSTNPRTIVLGKTIGIGLVGLLQVFVMIVVAVLSANAFMDRAVLESIFDLSNITVTLAIITLVYFMLGYLLYSLMFALTGSTVSKPEEIQSANGPVSIIAVIGFYLAYFSMMNPSSSINKLASIIPISSPFSMPLRVMMGTATSAEIWTSFGVLIITIAIIAIISIKVYSSAILNYGTKLSIKDIIAMCKKDRD